MTTATDEPVLCRCPYGGCSNVQPYTRMPHIHGAFASLPSVIEEFKQGIRNNCKKCGGHMYPGIKADGTGNVESTT